ncbi:hypothetical protein [Streptomyces sp. NPDC018055]|uniref:hypothetical protein n=1 Tax=Streptomyces sp. NPDC018055 TaxID=3365038 RepID=UPI0037A370A2
MTEAATSNAWWRAYDYARNTAAANRPTAVMWADHVLSAEDGPAIAEDEYAYRQWFDAVAEEAAALLREVTP